jgi:NOL1/NOP2/sun family putative RNA methylase
LTEQLFEHYRELISDFQEFKKASVAPAPEALRLNGWKNGLDKFEKWIETQGYKVEKSPYFSDLYYWRQPDRFASSTVLHWAGHYYIQDPVTLLPVRALDLRPGETVLDLCAAPGGKSFHISRLVGLEGCVVANDPSPGRRQILQSNLQRLGVPNLVITPYQGQSVPENKLFDAILVDAPCSGEGSNRWPDGNPPRVSKSDREHLINTQQMLLKKAARLLVPGGRIVYSTCTYSPLENEAVVKRILEETTLVIEEIELELPHEPGVESWDEKQFGSELKKLWRCYPHHYDGGGMVFARLRKPGEKDE